MQRRIEARERFVEEKHARLPRECATDRHPLLLATRKRAGGPIEQRIESQEARHGVDFGLRLISGHTSGAQAECQIVEDRQVRIQRGMLKNHGHIATMRGDHRHVTPVDRQLARARRLEPGDQAQQRRLPRSRRPEHDQELTRCDIQVDGLECGNSSRIALRYSPQFDLGQVASSQALRVSQPLVSASLVFALREVSD